MVATAWFDAVAPNHPTAVGAYSDLGRRPAAESATNENMNTAMFYAAYRVLLSMGPAYQDTWDAMLLGVGLDPNDNSTDLTSAVGIGNAAGNAVVAARENDGMNQLGNVDCTYNCQPYADYTGYEPVNSACELSDHSRWQPDIISNGYGLFEVQQFVTPQLSETTPFSYINPNLFKAPFPKDSQVQNEDLYQTQADQVLEVSAELSDEQKITAELFDDKIKSLGFSILHATLAQQLSLMEFVQLDFVTNVVAFDTAIAFWNQKYKYDAVRPFSAIEYLYGHDPVTAWGGPYQGTVTDLPASEWRSYLQSANHPEYPSASASFCAAHAEVASRFLGSDALNWTMEVPAGQSRVEPGPTPQTDTDLFFPTWDDFAERCGLSRLWGGVHFYPSIPAGQEMGREIGYQVFEYTEELIAGNRK
ncbi:MAG: vanadium-dependent haloperoxidase [Candidatus Promineifilaceae bacterium]|nr:vanadium-dependent haloperoxidase [Candidatus Promineifilaceae bacterium]